MYMLVRGGGNIMDHTYVNVSGKGLLVSCLSEKANYNHFGLEVLGAVRVVSICVGCQVAIVHSCL